jgi:type I restriction enzyme S subunit
VHGICSPAYTILKPATEIDDDFYRHYFKRESFISQLSATVIGIRDGKQISYDAFSGMRLWYPTVPEQRKIAEFINVIDEKIAVQNKQIEQIEAFKKYLLQKMFV